MGKAIRVLSFVLCCAIVLLDACQKLDTNVGTSLIPGNAYVNGIFTDTVTLKTKTIREDTLLTEDDGQFVLGSMADHIFGHSYAGIYSQFVPQVFSISLGDSAILDSTVLNLSLTGFYGDSNSYHNIRVYRLTDSMSSYIVIPYQSRHTFAHQSYPLGERLNYRVSKRTINDTSFTDIDGTVLGASLRIKLSPSLGQEILNQSPTGAFASNANFVQYLKGLYIDDDTSVGFSNSMIYVNLQGGLSMLEVYYHFPHIPTASNIPLRFVAGSGAVNCNYFNHNYQNKITRTALANATPAVDTVVYVQSMAGVKSLIQIPYLSKLGNVLINKAEIEVTVAQSDFPDTAIYHQPASMELVVADTTLTNAETVDQTFGSSGSGEPTFGGTMYYFVDATGHKYLRYKFSVAAQLQLMLNNKFINNGFYLLTYPSNEIGDRVIIGGGNRNGDPYQMRLNLVYTKIP